MIKFDRPLLSSIWKTSIPLMLGGFVTSAMTLIDSFFISKYSIHAFNSVILALPIIDLVITLATALGASLINILGKEQVNSNHKYHIAYSYILTLFVGIIMVLACYKSLNVVLSAAGLGGGLLPEEKRYFIEFWHYIVPSFIFQMLFSVSLQLLVFKKKIRFSNISMLTVAFINILLDFILVTVLDYGVKGAAIATNFAFLSGIIVMIIRFGKDILIQINLIQRQIAFALAIKSIGNQLYTSLILFVSISTYVIGNILINNLSVLYGAVAVTVIGTSEQLKSIFTLSTRGITGAYIIEFNKILNEREILKYNRVYWYATLLVGIIYCIGVIGFLFFPHQLLEIFNIKEALIKQHMDYSLRIASLLFIILIFSRIGQVGFLNLGHSYALFLQSLCGVGLMYFFANQFSKNRGVVGIIDGQLVGFLITAVIFIPYFFFLLRKKRKKDNLLSSASLEI